jgi:hypothetical protein
MKLLPLVFAFLACLYCIDRFVLGWSVEDAIDTFMVSVVIISLTELALHIKNKRRNISNE